MRRAAAAAAAVAAAAGAVGAHEVWVGRARPAVPFAEFEAQSIEEVLAGRLETGDVLLLESEPLGRPASLLGAAERWLAKRAGGTEWDGTAVVLRNRAEDAPYVLEHRTGEGFVLSTIEERLLFAAEPQMLLRQLRGRRRTHEQLDAAERAAAGLLGVTWRGGGGGGGEADGGPVYEDVTAGEDHEGPTRNESLGGAADPSQAGLFDALREASARREVRPVRAARLRLVRVARLAAAVLGGGGGGGGGVSTRVADLSSVHFLRETALPALERERAEIEARLADQSRLEAARGDEARQAEVRHRVELRARLRRAEQRALDGARQAEELERRAEAAPRAGPGAVPLFPSAGAAALVLQAMGVLPADGPAAAEYGPRNFEDRAPLRTEDGFALGSGSYLLSRESKRPRAPRV